MKNIFIQNEYGKCLYYCLANLLDDKSIIENGKDEAFTIDGRLVVERELPGHTTYHIIKHPYGTLPIKDSTKIFEIDPTTLVSSIPINMSDYFAAYILCVQSEKNVGKLHALLAIQDAGDQSIWVLDPHNENGVIMTPEEIVSKHNLMEVEYVGELTQGGLSIFRKQKFKHLFSNL